MSKKTDIFPSDGDLRGLLHFKKGVMCINNRNEIIVNNDKSITLLHLLKFWPLFLCVAIYLLLDVVVADEYSRAAKVSMACFLGLLLMHFGSIKIVGDKSKHSSSTKTKTFVNNEEEMSKVDVAKCAVEIRFVKLIKKKWKFKISISLANTDYHWREWRSFDELISVQSQLLKDFECCPSLTPQCRTLLKTPLDTEDSSDTRSHSSSSKKGEKISMEELNAKLRHKQVSILCNWYLFECSSSVMIIYMYHALILCF